MLFPEFNLLPAILRAVADEGYTTPSPIQAQSIPHVRDGHDLLGIAQTGTGKTAAFALPVLHRLAQTPQVHGPRPLRCLVLSPTRELAAQVGDSFRAYGRYLHLRTAVIFGGVGMQPQVDTLKRGLDILVACPGRLLDLMGQGHCRLDGIQILILDEADRMLDMGFMPDIKRIIAKVPAKRQTLLFTATMPGPIKSLADGLMHAPFTVSVAPVSSAAESVSQAVFHVPKVQKQNLLANLLSRPDVTRALVFTRTKHGADKVVQKLEKVGITAAAIHGNKSQNQRTKALASFKDGSMRVLVASDIAARGLDVDAVSHVVNFDLPNEPETYVHRIGRTGRAGATGIAWSFCDQEERAFLTDIERLIRRKVPVEGTPELPPPPPPGEDVRPPRQFQQQRRGGGGGRPQTPGGSPHRTGHSQPGRRDHGHGGGGGGGGGNSGSRGGRSSSW